MCIIEMTKTKEDGLVNRKFRYLKVLAAALGIFLLASCGNSANSAGTEQSAADGTGKATSSKVIKITNDMIKFDADDNYSEWKNQNPVYISFREQVRV